MPTFETRRRVAFSAEQMFDLVADVEQYPKFLPLCEGLTVLSRSGEPGQEKLTARMSVGYKSLKEEFTTRVTLDRPARRILVEHMDGPFSHLENRWRFEDAGAFGSDVHFHITYEFSSMMLRLVMGAVFEKAIARYTEAFEVRAREVYGRHSAART